MEKSDRFILKFSKRRLAMAAGALFAIFVLSEALPQERDPITGRDYTGVCASCHGSKGISTNPMVPSLAGQDRSYLIGQLQALRDKRRRHAAMEGIIAEMADGDIAYMATYYAKQIPMAGEKQLIFKKREKGEPFYKKCQGCHGDRAEGRDGIPRLAGQQAVYLEKTLLAYRAGERSAAGMNESVFALSPEEIKALSRFLSTLR